MSLRAAMPIGALVAVALVGGASCSSSSSTSKHAATTTKSVPDNAAVVCARTIDVLVSAARRYVGGFESPAPTAPMTNADFQAAVAAAGSTLTARGCNPTRTRTELFDKLSALKAKSPVADAVLRQVKATFAGEVSPSATVSTSKPGTDLRDALARLSDGSTLRLSAGEYRLDGPLVALSGVTIQGAGRDATTIVSTASDAAVIAVTGQRLELAGLTVRHTGNAAASVVLAGPNTSVVVTDARLTGARTNRAGQLVAGILTSNAARDTPDRGTTLEVTNVEVRDNATAGIALVRGQRASIVRATFVANGQCGVCFLNGSSGSVEDGRFDGNGAGIAATGNAAPTLLRNTITGGEVGLQAGDTAAPAVKGAVISGSRRAAIIYSGFATGSLDDVTCANVKYGLVLGPQTLPQVGKVDCALIRSR